MPNLVIIESPNKVKKLQAILGDGYEIVASVGHISDLPKKEMGVCPPNFTPQYEVTADKKGVVSKIIAKARSANTIYLATDPDREGEAIAFHLANLVGDRKTKRVFFNEITQSKVTAAFKKPSAINYNLVRAQESRRVIDRIVGYKVSPVLCEKSQKLLSAGRVQSAALLALYERTQKNTGFNSIRHYSVRAQFTSGDITWFADLVSEQIEDKSIAESFLHSNEFSILEFDKGLKKTRPPAAFMTSTLQQFASSKLKMKTKATMAAAQLLFENGLISYHRTDNPNLSDEFIQKIRTWAEAHNHQVPETSHCWKLAGDAQEGHEAIRVTSLDTESVSTGNKNADKLYKLIYDRTVCCQLDFCTKEHTQITLSQTNTKQSFAATASIIVDRGYLAFLNIDETKRDDSEQQSLPSLTKGEKLQSDSLDLRQLTTKPPALFTEATLVKFLDKEGIGRPSTFASIISTLFARDYIQEQKSKITPTELGGHVVKSLMPHFKFMDLKYTKAMESELDKIALGKQTYLTLVSELWDTIETELGEFTKADTIFPIAICEKCGSPMRTIPAKKGRYRAFESCSNYPTCNFSKSNQSQSKTNAKSVKDCPESNCDGQLFKRKGKFGPFLGCNKYPNCKYLEKLK